MNELVTKGEAREKDSLMSFIAGCLPEIRSEIIKSGSRTWDEVKDVVCRAESAIRGRQIEPRNKQLPGYDLQVLNAEKKRSSRPPNKATPRDNSISCYYCNKSGHYKSACLSFQKDRKNRTVHPDQAGPNKGKPPKPTVPFSNASNWNRGGRTPNQPYRGGFQPRGRGGSRPPTNRPPWNNNSQRGRGSFPRGPTRQINEIQIQKQEPKPSEIHHHYHAPGTSSEQPSTVGPEHTNTHSIQTISVQPDRGNLTHPWDNL